MAAKKKAASTRATATDAPTQAQATAIKRATADDVAPIEQAAPSYPKNPSDESVQTPTIDPTLSADNQHSTYSPSSLDFPPDQGNQVEETPGKPKAVKD